MVGDELRDHGRSDEPPTSDPANRAGSQGRAGDVSQILSAIEQGEGQAAEQVLPVVYDDLRKLVADKIARKKPGQTLQTVDHGDQPWA